MSFTLGAKLDTKNYEQCIIAGADRPTHDNNHLERVVAQERRTRLQRNRVKVAI